ncbi:MAG: hypothetical protein KY476_06125 [Planctomycetes bacterium]|nr:hypothetical protein [Planctomycetota bacterium]
MKTNGLLRLLALTAVATVIATAQPAGAAEPDGVFRLTDVSDGAFRLTDGEVEDLPPSPQPDDSPPEVNNTAASPNAAGIDLPAAGQIPPDAVFCEQCQTWHALDGSYIDGGYVGEDGSIYVDGYDPSWPPLSKGGNGGVNDGTGRFELFGPAIRPNRRGYFGGAAVVVLEADFDSNTAFLIDDQSGPVAMTTSVDFNFDEEANPRAWLGWQDGSGLAYRVTYFKFNDRRKVSAVAPANFVFFRGPETPTTIGFLQAGGIVGDVINARNAVEVYYIDAEISQELNFDRWQTTFGGGFRHVGLSQRFAARATSGPAIITSTVSQRFDGEGPTAFADVRIPFLGYKDRRYIGAANLSVFAHGRGSIVYGDAKLSARDVNPLLPGAQVATASLEDKDSVAIGELRVGGQFDMRPIDGTLIYVQLGYEGQWLNGANDFASLNDNNDLVLQGWFFSLGMDW